MSHIIDALNWRYATKQFSTKKISEEKRAILFESLRLSASSFGLQAWKFIHVESPELREALLPHAWGQRQVVDASELIVLARPEKITEKEVSSFLESMASVRNVPLDSLNEYKAFMTGFIEKMTDDQKANWMAKQIYIALGTLLTVAAVEEIDACPMEGFEPGKFDEVLSLEKLGLKSVVLCPIGYRSDEDKYATLAKVRFSTEDVFVTL